MQFVEDDGQLESVLVEFLMTWLVLRFICTGLVDRIVQFSVVVCVVWKWSDVLLAQVLVTGENILVAPGASLSQGLESVTSGSWWTVILLRDFVSDVALVMSRITKYDVTLRCNYQRGTFRWSSQFMDLQTLRFKSVSSQWVVGESRDSYQTLALFGWSIRYFYEVSKTIVCQRKNIECTFLLWGFFPEEFWPRKLISQTYGTDSGKPFSKCYFKSIFIKPSSNAANQRRIISVLLSLNFWNCPWIIWMCHDFVIFNVWTQFWQHLVLMISKHLSSHPHPSHQAGYWLWENVINLLKKSLL